MNKLRLNFKCFGSDNRMWVKIDDIWKKRYLKTKFDIEDCI